MAREHHRKSLRQTRRCGQQREALPTFTWKEVEYLVTAIKDYKCRIAAQMTELTQLRYKAQQRNGARD
jgi:hypothetical protein